MGKKIQTDKQCPDCGHLLIEEQVDVKDLVRSELKDKSSKEEILHRLQELVKMQCDPEEEWRRIKEIIPAAFYATLERQKWDAWKLYKYYQSSIVLSTARIQELINEGKGHLVVLCENCGYCKAG